MDFGYKNTASDLCICLEWVAILILLKYINTYLVDSADTYFFNIHVLILNISEALFNQIDN